MTVYLTGASGFLGQALAAHWRVHGFVVRDSGRARLGEVLPDAAFAGCDAVIHLAHDFAPGAAERNRQGTIAWFDAAVRAGVQRQIFVSSFSARADSASVYGATKFAMEQTFLERGAMVVRPGLVVGNGGMFARMVGTLRRLPVAPLVLPDARSVAVISLEDFLAAMTRLLEGTETGAWNLFAPSLLTGREFAHAVWRGLAKRGVVLGVWPGLALGWLRLVGAERELDSVRGQVANRVPVHRSNLQGLVSTPLHAAMAVELAAKGVTP